MRQPPDYEPTVERTVAAIAERRGVDPLAAMYDLMLEADAGAALLYPMFDPPTATMTPSGRCSLIRPGCSAFRTASRARHDLRRVVPDLPADALGP